MSLSYNAGNQRKAQRVAREMVRDLAPTDIDITLTNNLDGDQDRRLAAAVHQEYVKNEKRLIVLFEQISKALGDESEKLFDEYEELRIANACTREIARFNLGWAAAVRLMGADERKGGGR